MYEFPKSRQQKEFEDLATELLKVLAGLREEQQNALFEYAQRLSTERNSSTYTQWDK